jgi:ADP-ribosylglycohydrolase
MYGCIVGAFIGDSCGSFREFSHEVGNEKIMKECLKMPGGGPFCLNPGQVTDDSELAMSLMWALI